VPIRGPDRFLSTSETRIAARRRHSLQAAVPDRHAGRAQPSGGWYTKRCPSKSSPPSVTGSSTASRRRSSSVGSGELSDVEKIQRAMRHAAVIPPETTLLELAGLLERMAFVVTNDSDRCTSRRRSAHPFLGIYGRPTRCCRDRTATGTGPSGSTAGVSGVQPDTLSDRTRLHARPHRGARRRCSGTAHERPGDSPMKKPTRRRPAPTHHHPRLQELHRVPALLSRHDLLDEVRPPRSDREEDSNRQPRRHGENVLVTTALLPALKRKYRSARSPGSPCERGPPLAHHPLIDRSRCGVRRHGWCSADDVRSGPQRG